MDTYLICGLGNPGTKYEYTRHNAGQMVIKSMADHHQLRFSTEPQLSAQVSDFMYINEERTARALFCAPTTFMNDSGIAITAIAHYYKIPLQNIIIIHDDVDIALGIHKFTFNSQAAGHHGVESVIEHLNSQEFWRIRIGIASDAFEATKKQITDKTQRHEYVGSYVLDRFTSEEQASIFAQVSDIMSWIASLPHEFKPS